MPAELRQVYGSVLLNREHLQREHMYLPVTTSVAKRFVLLNGVEPDEQCDKNKLSGSCKGGWISLSVSLLASSKAGGPRKNP